jgi:hypothetical protein
MVARANLMRADAARTVLHVQRNALRFHQLSTPSAMRDVKYIEADAGTISKGVEYVFPLVKHHVLSPGFQ